MTPYSLLHICQRFGVTRCIYLQSTRLSRGKDGQGRQGLRLEVNHGRFILYYSSWFARNLRPFFPPLPYIIVRFTVIEKFPPKQQYVIQITGSDTRIISLSFSQHIWKCFLRCAIRLGLQGIAFKSICNESKKASSEVQVIPRQTMTWQPRIPMKLYKPTESDCYVTNTECLYSIISKLLHFEVPSFP